MEVQAGISGDINRRLIGTSQEVLVEGKSELSGYTHVGRCRRQAPEIDGVTHMRGGEPEAGELVACRIAASDEYDLFADGLIETICVMDANVGMSSVIILLTHSTVHPILPP